MGQVIPRIHRRAFTIMELMVVTVIIAILLALIVPALNTVRAMAAEQVCKNNLNQISKALQTYSLLNNGFLPQHREGTDGTYYPSVYAWFPTPVEGMIPRMPRGYSWQHILDKLLEADNAGGNLYNSGDYNIAGELVNTRGASRVFTDRVAGYGAGVYIGTYGAFYYRLLPDGQARTGPLNLNELMSQKAMMRDVPIVADGSRANSDDVWLNRMKNPAQIFGTNFDKPHVSVIAQAAYLPTESNVISIDFRHRSRAFVLYLDWSVREWKMPAQDSLAQSDPMSSMNQYKRLWDTMFPKFIPPP